MDAFAIEIAAKNGATRTVKLGAGATLTAANLGIEGGADENVMEVFKLFSEGEVMRTYQIDETFKEDVLETPSKQAHRELCVRVGVKQTHPVVSGPAYQKNSFFTLPCANTTHMVAGTNNATADLADKLKAWVDTNLQYSPYDTSKTYRYAKFITYNS